MSFLTVENHSRWPTAAVFVLGKWALRRAGLYRAYWFGIKESENWCAASSPGHIQIELQRRFQPRNGWPMPDWDPMTVGPRVQFMDRLELLVFMIGFAMCESAMDSYGDTALESRFRGRNWNRQEWEKLKDWVTNVPNDPDLQANCDNAGNAAVTAFRSERSSIRTLMKRAIRQLKVRQDLQERCEFPLELARMGSPMELCVPRLGAVHVRFIGIVSSRTTNADPRIIVQYPDGNERRVPARCFTRFVVDPAFPENAVRILKKKYTQ